jgi:hypothetical protein
MKNSIIKQVDWRDLLNKTPTPQMHDYEELASLYRKDITGTNTDASLYTLSCWFPLQNG